MKIHTFVIVLALLVSALLASCALPGPKPIDAAPGKLSSIRSITVVRYPPGINYRVVNLNRNIAPGLLESALESAEQARGEKFAAKLTTNDKGLSAFFAKAIAEKLRSAGYEVSLLDGPWERGSDGHLALSYEKINSASDALLIMKLNFIGFGMQFGALSSLLGDYVPWVTSELTLLDAGSKEIIYRSYYSNGVTLRTRGWKNIPPKRKFGNLSSLEKDFENAVESLNEAVQTIAEAVAVDLQK